VVAAVVAMSNPNKRKGTSWESSIVDTLRANGWSDLNARAIVLGAWLDEANVERDNDHADLGVVWFKRRGKVDAGAGYVLMDGRTFARLLTGAGYGGSAE
jgi:hypothetical protein